MKSAAREGTHNAFQRIVSELLPDIEDKLDDHFARATTGDLTFTVLDLLHPRIVASSYEHFRSGHFRDAVLNGVVAVFDLIRERTGVDKDGVALVGEVFSLENPKLVFTTLESESGKNDKKGFMQILQGAYVGIRNPKAHSLGSDLDLRNAGQYLVFLSLLVRRVEEATVPVVAT